MRNLLFLFLLFQLLFLTSNSYSSTDDCGTTGSITTNSIPTSGTIKVFVVFAQFKDDSQSSTEWSLNTYPSWANDFVSASGSGPFAYNNLSQYYYSMSNGVYQVEGDVYNSLMITNQNESYYSSIGAANYEILTRVAADPAIDFSQYDNLNGASFGHDGKVDFIYIIYRNVATLFRYTGIAHLELSSTIYTDGVQIVGHNGFYDIGSGVQQRGGFNGRDYTMYVSAHEMGHYLFGAGHIYGTSNLALMPGGPAWNAARGMCAWEKHRLGWISYTDISSDSTATLTDYMSTGCAYRILVSGAGSSEYFLVENRKNLNTHDFAGDNGIYIYRVTNANSFPPTITVDCADGNWNFSVNTSDQTLTRTTPNPSGYNELNYSHNYGGILYACYRPVYPTNAMWGDVYDAFDQTYNNVFSPVSNPRSTNYAGVNFTIEITGSNEITTYFTNPYEGVPSKPQNLNSVYSSWNKVELTWSANTEPDLSSYKIYKAKTSGEEPTSYDYLTTVSSSYTSWTDPEITFGDPSHKIFYKITAVDNTNKESVLSNYSDVNYLDSQINTNTEILPSSTVDVENDLTVNNGITLFIENGTSLTFNNGSSLIVNGTLEAQGAGSDKVTFDFVTPSNNSSNPNGIVINSTGTATISNGAIKNAYTGITIYEAYALIGNIHFLNISQNCMELYGTRYASSEPIIVNNVFDDPLWGDGILLYYSSPKLEGNEFHLCIDGIRCMYNSSPSLGYNNDFGNNKIYECGYGVYAYYGSSPTLGRSSCVVSAGHNSIYSNTQYNVYADQNCTILAEGNWWGEYFDANKFEAINNSSIDYLPYLSYNPNPSVVNNNSSPEEIAFNKTFATNNNSSENKVSYSESDKASVSTDSITNIIIQNMYNYDEAWPIKWKLLFARRLMEVGKYSPAIYVCKEVITQNPDSSLSYYALDLLWKASNQSKNTNSFKSFLKGLIATNNLNSIAGSADLILAGYQKTNKLGELERIRKTYKDKHVIEAVYYGEFTYYLKKKANKVAAFNTLKKLDKEFPNSPSSKYAHFLYGDKNEVNGNKLKKPTSLDKTITPQKYSLLGNYPNPFNPTTNISYELPRNSKIELTIYDMAGKVIRQFNISSQGTGRQNIIWNGMDDNGNKVSSGIYIYHFKATALEGKTEVFEKSAKLILMK